MMPTHKDTSSVIKSQPVRIIQSNNSARYVYASHSPTSISSSEMSTLSPSFADIDSVQAFHADHMYEYTWME